MRVFKNKWFDRFCGKQLIDDEMLCALVKEIEANHIDVDYGGSVIKQRMARKNQGKSGGYRCIILYRMQDKVFFVYGFAKNNKDNISDEEVNGFKALASQLLELSNEALKKLIEAKVLIEVPYDKE
ncbi:type II toxin-antitoxin system RelE/ParE family toxin [Legionella sp. MW5194]|uniref:type II toxin-antitoxin system RelE/ParE family toxin n=1 Tax=Legionella sp. MW5194 TaxID=2662448 RepID=UPI00193DA168|nr:type II toxin-antitoxin system RelE/ParE family toxin [Legionella sp. MW5194]QRN05054.1 type II toxin-antitoxin system RelE/ParE family toxin [Legionella sp. MW5194]